jgi:hypothetical protein
MKKEEERGRGRESLMFCSDLNEEEFAHSTLLIHSEGKVEEL